MAKAAANVSGAEMRRACAYPSVQFVTQRLVELPLLASALEFETANADLGIGLCALASVTELLAGLNGAICQQEFGRGRSSDAGEMARAALLASLSEQMRDRLASLIDVTLNEVR